MQSENSIILTQSFNIGPYILGQYKITLKKQKTFLAPWDSCNCNGIMIKTKEHKVCRKPLTFLIIFVSIGLMVSKKI